MYDDVNEGQDEPLYDDAGGNEQQAYQEETAPVESGGEVSLYTQYTHHCMISFVELRD